MHLIIFAFTLLSAWKWGDFKNWKKYHTTMLAAGMGNLLYNFLYHDHLLWQLKPDFFSHTLGEIVYSFMVFPLTVLIFLTGYPKEIKSQIFHNLKFIAIYIILEWVYKIFGKIVYNYGWNIWWSLAWDFMMFPVWALHHKKPLIAYVISFIIVVIVLLLFPVNFK